MNIDNFSSVLIRYVDLLKIPIGAMHLRNELRKHPDYNSLLAYNDVLANYGIYTGTYRVGFDQLSKITLPAITYLSDRNYTIITEVGNGYVLLADEKKKRKKISNEEFKKHYTGIVQVKESVDPSLHYAGAKDRGEKFLSMQPYAGLLVAALLIVLFFVNSSFSNNLSWPLLLLILFKASGIFFSCLLLIQSMDANSPLIHRFCTTSDKIDCGAILATNAAKLTSFLSWSEVGFFYFAGSFLVMLFVPSAISILAWLNLFALPYTFYSIYYQYRVAQKWCTLCCAVQVLLWAEFFGFLPYLSLQLPQLGSTDLVNASLLLFIPVISWLLLKPFISKLSTSATVEEQLRVLKYNKQIFSTALKEIGPFEAPSTAFAIVLGSNEPKHIITMVASPYCKPCAQAHQQVEQTLATMDNLQIRIVFAGNDLTRTDEGIAVRRQLMALQQFNDPSLTRKALKDWYSGSKRNYQDWSAKYQVSIPDEVDGLLTQQRQWLKTYQISQTPTILINGYQMPLIYQLHELKYMLDD